MLAAGTILGSYQIIRLIAEGGMAGVYLAVHIRLGHQVALKVLNSDLAADKNLVRRFQREAMMMSRMQHPHVVKVYDAGEAGGVYYFAMELLTEGSLQNDIARTGAMSASRALDITRQIASALEYAHRHEAIHRDIKPGNILRAKDGRWVLTDFGIALAQDATRLTRTSLMMGTPAYMSPEQGQGLALDRRSDLYSLGVVLFEMITGNLPFVADTPMGVIYKQIDQPPPRLNRFRGDVPPELQLFLDRCMAKRPQDRFQNAGQLISDIDHLWTGQPMSFRSAPFRPIRKQSGGQSRGNSSSALASIILGIAIGLVGLVVLMALTSPPAASSSTPVTPIRPATAPVRVTMPPPTTPPQPVPKPGQASYAVQSGDTLFSIAARFGVSTDALLRVNGLASAASLRVGDTLVIPLPESTPKPTAAPLSAALKVAFSQGEVGCSHITTRSLGDGWEKTFSAGPDTEDPSWSPDGSMVVAAVGECNASPARLVVFNVTTGSQQDLPTPSGALDPDWGRDGRIYFAQGSRDTARVFWIDPATGALRDLNREGRQPTLSPDRAWLAYMRKAGNDWRVFVAPVRNSGMELGDECMLPLPAAPGGVYARMPNWMVDSSRRQRVVFNITDAATLSVALGLGDPTMCSAELLSLAGAPVALARPACNADGFCVANQASSTTDSTRGLHRISAGVGDMWNYVEQLTTNEDYAADIYP